MARRSECWRASRTRQKTWQAVGKPRDRGDDAARLGRGVIAVALMLSLLAIGCTREPVDATPEGAVNEFLHRMASVHGEAEYSEAAFELLAPAARSSLEERSARATAVAGRYVAPYEMLVPSRFNLAFRPVEFSSEISGQWAIVTVTGEAEDESAQIRCELVDGGWKIIVDLPPLPPIQYRDVEVPPPTEPSHDWAD